MNNTEKIIAVYRGSKKPVDKTLHTHKLNFGSMTAAFADIERQDGRVDEIIVSSTTLKNLYRLESAASVFDKGPSLYGADILVRDVEDDAVYFYSGKLDYMSRMEFKEIPVDLDYLKEVSPIDEITCSDIRKLLTRRSKVVRIIVSSVVYERLKSSSKNTGGFRLSDDEKTVIYEPTNYNSRKVEIVRSGKALPNRIELIEWKKSSFVVDGDL